MIRGRRLRAVLTGLLLGIGLLASPAGALARNRLSVLPFPGTPDASASSQIVFPALKPSDLEWVFVGGSESGPHVGRLSLLPQGAGTVFVPSHPFTPGELVTVSAALRSRQAGRASGDPGSRRLRWRFAVAVKEPASGRPAADTPSPRRGASDAAGGLVQNFYSQPDVHPPLLGVTRDLDPESGDIFLTPTHTLQPGPMIVDGRGRLLWFEPRSLPAYNLQVESYLGRPVLTWWQGIWLGSVGEDVIVNQSYKTVATVRAGEGYASDLHEFQITPQGTALIDIYSPVRANLTGIGGSSSGRALDCIVQEVDIRTGRLLWEWHALGHVPISASYTGTPNPGSAYDFFHINSIQELPSGNFLVSSRSDWAVYEISRRTGNVIWSLGGKHSSFKMGPGANFEWQHDAHLNPDGTLTVFDDAGSPQEEPQSSGKILRLNTQTMTATLVHRFRHSPRLSASLAGSMQTLPNHNVLVAWGSEPDFSEYTPSGQLVLDGSFPIGVYSYRAYRFPWTGHPATRPALAVLPAPRGGTNLYASWNGDTQVAYWRVLAGSYPNSLSALGPVARWTGFETRIRRRSRWSYWAVQALDAQHHVLRTSLVKVMTPSG
jgi:Arylsulfotransferase (ASST)